MITFCLSCVYVVCSYFSLISAGSDGDNWRIWSVPIGAGSYLSKKPVPAYAACER